MKSKKLLRRFSIRLWHFALCTALALGCESNEKVLDIEGPEGGGVEVERDRDTGEVDVDVSKEREKILDVDTPGTDVEITRNDENGSVDVDAN
jgi:hypothetical protein